MRTIKCVVEWGVVIALVASIVAWAGPGPDNHDHVTFEEHSKCPHCHYAKRAFRPFGAQEAAVLDAMTSRRIEATVIDLPSGEAPP
jgi:hypothetical protein